MLIEYPMITKQYLRIYFNFKLFEVQYPPKNLRRQIKTAPLFKQFSSGWKSILSYLRVKYGTFVYQDPSAVVFTRYYNKLVYINCF